MPAISYWVVVTLLLFSVERRDEGGDEKMDVIWVVFGVLAAWRGDDFGIRPDAEQEQDAHNPVEKVVAIFSPAGCFRPTAWHAVAPL